MATEQFAQTLSAPRASYLNSDKPIITLDSSGLAQDGVNTGRPYSFDFATGGAGSF
ncbi:MAG TPA: hypothetical protein VER96_01970 [Polyangiaceae bacterium]|nr:hypothetical protein [Polyangiaceae bacterium]